MRRAKSEKPAKEGKKRGGFRRKLLVFLACVAAAAGITYASYSYSLGTVHKEVAKVSDLLVDDMQSGKNSQAYQLTSVDFKRMVSQTDFDLTANVVHTYTTKSTKHELNWAFKNNKAKRAYAQINYRLDGTKKPYYVRVVMQKEGTVWRVLLINVAETPYPKTIPTIE